MILVNTRSIRVISTINVIVISKFCVMKFYLIGWLNTNPYQTRVYLQAKSDDIAREIYNSISDDILNKEFLSLTEDDEKLIRSAEPDDQLNQYIILHQNLPILTNVPIFKHLKLCNEFIISNGIKYLGSLNSGITIPKSIYHTSYKSYSGSTIIMIDPFQKVYYDVDMS